MARQDIIYSPSGGIKFTFPSQAARYYSSVTIIYVLTLLFGVYIFRPFYHFRPASPIKNTPVVAVPPAIVVTSGLPVRIVIGSIGLDLPIDQGFYNPADSSWTLSGYHAQFAMPSSLANDYSGDTFIYGHNNRFVFGPLKYMPVGSEALIYTDNGHVFSYIYQDSRDLTPEDTSILNYKGPPMLTVQTCSGSLFEWRQLFRFSFDRLVQ